MEEARVDWMDKIGFGFDRVEAERVVSPVLSLSCNYLHTTTFKDTIVIKVRVEKMTNLKITFAYTMTHNDRIVCTAQSTHCFLENNRPISIERRFPQLYKAICTQIEQDNED